MFHIRKSPSWPRTQMRAASLVPLVFPTDILTVEIGSLQTRPCNYAIMFSKQRKARGQDHEPLADLSQPSPHMKNGELPFSPRLCPDPELRSPYTTVLNIIEPHPPNHTSRRLVLLCKPQRQLFAATAKAIPRADLWWNRHKLPILATIPRPIQFSGSMYMQIYAGLDA